MVGLLVALVGVGGTLGSAWLTQRRDDAARREDREHLERVRLAEVADRHFHETANLRKSAYTAFNSAARNYLACLNDYTHALRLGAEQDETLDTVETARRAYRQQYAEAQMIVPDTVLSEVRRVNNCLGAVYGILTRITRGIPRNGEDIAAARDRIKEAWQVLSDMRATMRADLKVTGPSYD
ncbi:hypothetical protein AB0D86_48485 [Streptomyces sp. NPDC048324]|uniref:hypothetical protein n=1 Tax=Streptomyces sp. NPDC048324 TaxID=3157205 RepID=UPI003449495A